MFEKAKRLGYGLRIIPRVREILFGRPAPTSNIVREKRKLRDPRRPPRLTTHVSRSREFNFLLATFAVFISQVSSAKVKSQLQKSSPRN